MPGGDKITNQGSVTCAGAKISQKAQIQKEMDEAIKVAASQIKLINNSLLNAGNTCSMDGPAGQCQSKAGLVAL